MLDCLPARRILCRQPDHNAAIAETAETTEVNLLRPGRFPLIAI
jgi:hypothetical protein